MSEKLNIRKEICKVVRRAGFVPSDIIDVQITPVNLYVSAQILTSDVRDEVKVLCEAAGYDANSVAGIKIGPDEIRFEIYMEPKQTGADGPLTVWVTHPYGGKA